MSEAPTYTIGANLRWFGLVYVVALVVLVVFVGYLQTLAIELPATGLGIGLFAGLVAVAGQRFAARRDWTGRDRNLLALGYMSVAATISCLLAAALTFVDASMFGEMAGNGGLAGMAFAVVVVVALLYFITARVTLMLIARRLAGAINRGNT